MTQGKQLLFFGLQLLVAVQLQGSVIHVVPEGAAAGDGSLASPLSGLVAARARAREVLSSRPGEPLEVRLRAGTYHLTEMLVFGPEDSGTETAPVIWRAATGAEVRISGAAQLDPTAFTVVTDPAVLARLPVASQGFVYRTKLADHGIDNIGDFPLRGYKRPVMLAAMELFIDDEPMTLARWPNSGYEPLENVVDPGSNPRNGDYSGRGATISYVGDRPQRWVNAPDVHCYGFWGTGWADDWLPVASINTSAMEITFSEPHLYSVKWASTSRWYAANLLEEIDAAGEYYIDRSGGWLYLWPPDGFAQARVEVSLLDAPALLHFKDAAWVAFEGIVFEKGRGMGVAIQGGSHLTFSQCIFRCLGTVGANVGRGAEPFPRLQFEGTSPLIDGYVGQIRAILYNDPLLDRDGGSDHTFVNCTFANLGEGGVFLGGGNRKTLTPGNNGLLSCTFHNLNRAVAMERPAMAADGVGNYIENSVVEGIPHNAVYYYGNDIRIINNRFIDNNWIVDDGGIVYTGRDWTMRGAQIINNLIMNSAAPQTSWLQIGVYLDDLASGNIVERNLFFNQPTGISVGGGRDNIVRENVFLRCDGTINGDARGTTWMKASTQPGGLHYNRLLATPYKTGSWVDAYPKLATILAGDNQRYPAGNIIQRNISANSGETRYDSVFSSSSTISANLSRSNEADFVNVAAGDLRLRPESTIYSLLPGFAGPDIDSMGPLADILLFAESPPVTLAGPDGAALFAIVSGPQALAYEWKLAGEPLTGAGGPVLLAPLPDAYENRYELVVHSGEIQTTIGRYTIRRTVPPGWFESPRFATVFGIDAGNETLFLYDPILHSWMWTNASLFGQGYLYDYSRGWVWHAFTGNPRHRVFWSFTDQAWIW